MTSQYRDHINISLSMPTTYINNVAHDEIARQTAEFLAKGGKINGVSSGERTIKDAPIVYDRKSAKVKKLKLHPERPNKFGVNRAADYAANHDKPKSSLWTGEKL